MLAVFPELGLCSYAIEHLLFQDALLDAVERALVALARVSNELDSMLVIGAPVCAEGKLFKLRGNVPD